MNNQGVLLSIGAVILFVVVLGGGYIIAKQESCRDFSQGRVIISKPFDPNGPEVAVNGHPFRVAIAKSAVEQTRGLAGCEKLPEDGGMYFPYNVKQTPAFWMKGMRIPIDIVWIADNKVVGIVDFVPVPSGKLDQELPRYTPTRPIDAVLEIQAGAAKEFGIAVDDVVQFIPASK